MKRRLVASCLLALALGTVPLAHARLASAASGRYLYRHMCGAVIAGWARCDSIIRIDTLQPNSTEATGFTPADLQSAYNLTSATAGSGQTVAIVDAFDDPKAESDLALYRATFHLPPCTTANGCFKKVNELGQTSPLPKTDPSGGWEGEESLDLDMVSAICPKCKIILVEATNNNNLNLGIAVDAAAKLGANAISNSYGGSEAANELFFDRFYKHPGIAVTASSGDSGFGAQYPAASPYVTAVGGTSLAKAHGGTDWAEIAWSGAGSGCSQFEPKPSWQTGAISNTVCAKRTIADVSAVADPNTGVAVYDSFPQSGFSCTPPACWYVYGGTSVASPIIASVYALAGNASSVIYGSYPYAHAGTSSLNDIVEGYNNGNGAPGCNFPSPLCTGVQGYDGPTGVGTPNGTGGF